MTSVPKDIDPITGTSLPVMVTFFHGTDKLAEVEQPSPTVGVPYLKEAKRLNRWAQSYVRPRPELHAANRIVIRIGDYYSAEFPHTYRRPRSLGKSWSTRRPLGR